MTSDPISDLLATVKNGYMAHKKEVSIPYSKLKEVLAKVLYQNGYLAKVTISETGVRKKSSIRANYQSQQARTACLCQVEQYPPRPGRIRLCDIIHSFWTYHRRSGKNQKNRRRNYL